MGHKYWWAPISFWNDGYILKLESSFFTNLCILLKPTELYTVVYGMHLLCYKSITLFLKEKQLIIFYEIVHNKFLLKENSINKLIHSTWSCHFLNIFHYVSLSYNVLRDSQVSSWGLTWIFRKQFPQRRSKNKWSQNLTFMETKGKGKASEGRRGRKKGNYTWGNSWKHHRSSPSHCHNPETHQSYPEAFSQTELRAGNWRRDYNGHSPS